MFSKKQRTMVVYFAGVSFFEQWGIAAGVKSKFKPPYPQCFPLEYEYPR